MTEHWPDGCDLLVVDHYERDQAFETACRPWARRLMVIDDLADRGHDCDLLLDQTWGREGDDYRGLVPPQCRLLTGSRHALLRPQFAAARRAALERRDAGAALRRILVCMGATDPDNVTAGVLDAIEKAAIGAAVDVVLGHGAPHLEDVRARAAGMSDDVTVRVGIAEMAELMGEADLAIGAAGTASWERCCLGLPTLLMVLADNQRLVAENLERAGAVRIMQSVEDLATTADERRRMSLAAAAVCDGLGVARVVLHLLAPQTAADGRPVTLRPATFADSERMLQWQQDERTRQFSRNPDPPERAAHERWLRQVLTGTDRILGVIEHGGEPAGVLRFDPASEASGLEVSILVAPEKYRLGIAGAALALARKLFAEQDIYAEVLPGNAASHRLFQGAGYRPVRDGRYVNEGH